MLADLALEIREGPIFKLGILHTEELSYRLGFPVPLGDGEGEGFVCGKPDSLRTVLRRVNFQTNVEVLASKEIGSEVNRLDRTIRALCYYVYLLIRREDATQGWAGAQSLERLGEDGTCKGDSCGTNDLGKDGHFGRRSTTKQRSEWVV